jgi:receptor protein-tyrosine kinase
MGGLGGFYAVTTRKTIMNTIELAAQRLQQLAGTGVENTRVMPGQGRTEGRVGTVSGVAGAAAGAGHPNSKDAVRPLVDPVETAAVPTASRQSDSVTLNIEALEESGVLVSCQSRTAMAEQFRHAKRPLLDNVRKGRRDADDRRSLIMVTSALPGEGKTFCSINLAWSMAAEVDTSVLLVDADVVRCNLLRTLGVAPRKGLLDLLGDSGLDLSDVIVKTNVPRLCLLPAGTPNVRSTELLASTGMNQLLLEMAARYSDRVIIFDSSPLLLTSEAKVLASNMGQIVMVAEESNTPYAALQKAFAAVKQCPVVMSLLNKGREPAPYYGSYYE